MVQPKKLNTGLPRVATTDQVPGAMDRTVEREQQNRINKRFTSLVDGLQQQIDNLPTGGGGDGSFYDLSVDESNFSLTNVEGDSWFLDIIPGGIGTTELADEAVTTVKLGDEAVTTGKIDDLAVTGAKLEDLADSGTGTLLAITRDTKGRVSGTRATIPSDFPAPTINTTPGDFIVPLWDSGTSTLTANLRAKTVYSDITVPVVDFINKGDRGAIHFFVDAGASFTVQGISDGEEGAFFVLENDPSSLGDVILENDSGVFIANYVKTPDGLDYTIPPGNAVILRYVFDATYADPGYWVFYATTGAGGGSLRPKTNDIEAVAGDVRFILDKLPAEDEVFIYKDGIRMFQSQFTGTGMFRYLVTPAAGGETFTFDYFTTDSGTIADTYMDNVGVVFWSPIYPSGMVGTPYDYTPSPASGGTPPYTYYVVNVLDLPPGLTFDSSDGRLYGTPTDDSGSPYTFSVYAEDTMMETSTPAPQSVTILGAITYTTWDPSNTSPAAPLSNGNLTMTNAAGSVFRGGFAVSGKASSTSKIAYHVRLDAGISQSHVMGVATSSANYNIDVGANATGWAYYSDGYFANNAVYVSGKPTSVVGDWITVCFDNGKVGFLKNGIPMSGFDPVAGTGWAYTGITGTIFPMASVYNFNAQITADFAGAVSPYPFPVGYTGWTS